MLIRHALLIIVAGLLYGNPANAQSIEVDTVAIRNLVSEWNDAHSLNTLENLSSLYSEKVNFYGSLVRRSKCISVKRQLLEKHTDFKQVVKSDLVLSGYSSGVIKCNFVKTVSQNNKTVIYESYLIIEKNAGEYYIVGESDLITDRNIKNQPQLGARVEIINKPDEDTNTFTDVLLLGGSLAVGVVGLLVAFRSWRKSQVLKKSRAVDKDLQRQQYFEKGMAFEQFVVEQFGIYKDYFTLLDWRSDKIHQGIFPKSNHNPDLEYEYKFKEFVRTFSVECKYRRKTWNGAIQIMDADNYRNYEAFHRNKMPVYIALGFGGEPNDPAELYLIPFEEVSWK